MISKHPLSLAIALAGAAVMAALAFGLLLPPDRPFMATKLYDIYAAALLDGHFDLPLRELRSEGHYTPDGTGYLYHGLGPLLTRLPFAPFVDFPTSWISPLSIWFWAVAGTMLYHKAFLFALERAPFGESGVPDTARTMLALLVWFGAPGLLLTANVSLFYEPVSMAYAMGGGIVLLIVKLAFGAITPARALLPLSVLAGLTVHARPHLAVGYYACVCLIAAVAAFRGSRRTRMVGAASVCILGLFGAALIASNAMRFNGATTMHGSFSEGELQYGMVYWGSVTEDSPRALAFEHYGRFNAKRVVPNAIVYVAMPPAGMLADPVRRSIETAFQSLQPWTGFIQIEEPNVGTLFLWPLWTVLMVVGLRQKALWRMPGVAGVAGVAIGSLLLFAYATITTRYHVDIWPAIALPAAFGIGPLAAWAFDPARKAQVVKAGLVALLAVGIAVTTSTVGRSRNALQTTPGLWTHDFCLRITALKGFSPERGRELCRLGYEEDSSP